MSWVIRRVWSISALMAMKISRRPKWLVFTHLGVHADVVRRRAEGGHEEKTVSSTHR